MVHFMVLGHEHLISNTNLDFYKLYKPKLQWQLGWLGTVLFEYFDNDFLGFPYAPSCIDINISVDCKTNADDKLFRLSY